MRDPTRIALDSEALALIATAAVLIGAGYAIWQQIPVNLHFYASLASLTCYVLGFVLLLLSAESRAPRSILALAGMVAAFTLYAGCTMAYGTRYYGTDSLLFNAYSADLLMHGIDPYTQSMQPAFRAFNAPESLVTPTIDGNPVFKLSYPALSFLIYVPALALHVYNLLWVSVGAQLAIVIGLWFLAPRNLRPLVPLLLFVDTSYAQYAVGAVTDVLWVVPAIFAAAYWSQRIPLSAALLGIACAIKQTPWLLVPFAIVEWGRFALARRSLAAVLTPLAILMSAFFIPNLPFVAWHPQAWAEGVTEPLGGKLVMFGSGIVQLQTANMYALDPKLLSLVALGVVLAAVALYALYPVRLVVLPFVAPAVAFFLAPRSLQNYFMYWPVLLAARLTHPLPAEDEVRLAQVRALRRFAPALLGATFAIGAALFLVHGVAADVNDARLAIAKTHVDDEDGFVDALTVRASSGGHAPRYVRFALYQEGGGVDFQFVGNNVIRLDPAPRLIELRVPRQVAAKVDVRNALQVVAVDAFTGQQFFSKAQNLDLNTVLIRNGRLSKWARSPFEMPLAWEFDQQDVRQGRIRRDGARNTLRFDVAPPSDAEWRVASISQTVNASPGVLYFRLFPLQDYVGNAYPQAIFGIEVIDSFQNHTYYAIDSKLQRPKVYRRDRFTVNVLPGRLDAWNDVAVQVRPTSGDAPFQPPNATVDLNVIAAVTKDIRVPVIGYFGGVAEKKSLKETSSLTAVR